MSFPFLLFSVLLTSISAQTSLFEGSAKSSLPYYSSVPLTNFRCDNQQFAGYYSDPEADCQVFHICIRRHEKLEQFSFLCPNETVFHQQLLVCVWWDGFECTSAPSLYYLNENIFEDHATNLDLEAHVAISQGKSFISDDKVTPTSPAKDSVSIGKALLSSVKPSSEARSLEFDNKLESKISGNINQITKKPEVKVVKQIIKPSKPSYLPQKTSRKRPSYLPEKNSRIQHTDLENQKIEEQEVISNPDFQLLSQPHFENLISTTSSPINDKNPIQTSTQPSFSKAKITKKVNDVENVKEVASGVKLNIPNIPASPFKQTSRKSKIDAGVRKSITRNDNKNSALVQTKTNISLQQNLKSAKAIQSPFSTVQSKTSPKINFKEHSLRQNKNILSTPVTLNDKSVPVKVSQKTIQKATTSNPFTRVQSTASARPISQTSSRQNIAALSTPKSFRDNNIVPKLKSLKVKSKAPTHSSSTAAPLSTSRNPSTPAFQIITSDKLSQGKNIKITAQKSKQKPPLKTTVQRNQQKPLLKNRSKSIPNRSLSKGLTTYDILHDLLKNVTILRSQKLLKINSVGGRRNVRQNYIEKPLIKPPPSKVSSSGAERSSPKQTSGKSRVKIYSNRNKDTKSSYYNTPETFQSTSEYGKKLYSNPTKASNLIDTPQNPSSTTTEVHSSTSTFVPTLPPTDIRKKTTQKKSYLNVSSKNKNIQIKNFQDFLNLDLPLKSSQPSSQPSQASSFPSPSPSSNNEDSFSLLTSNIYDSSAAPKYGLYK